MRVESGGGALLGSRGHGLPPPQESQVYQRLFFEPLAAGDQRPLWLVFLCYSTWSGIQRAPLAGVLLRFSVHQVLIGASWVGSYSAVLSVRCLMGQPLYCSAANAGLWGKRGCGDGSTATHDSALSPCFHGCLAFPTGIFLRRFPPQSPPARPLSPSLCHQQQPSLGDCSTNATLQLPAAASSREPASLSGVCMATARTV